MRTNTVLIRLVFIGILIGAGYLLDPIGHAMPARTHLLGIPTACFSSLLGLVIACVIILFEMRIQQASLKTLIGAGIGSMMGIVGGVLIGFLISYQEAGAVHPSTKVFLTLALAFIMAYIGLMVGAAKGDYLDLTALGGIFSDKATRRDVKILDTSVIIDGRIADVAETGFLSGTIVIPQFLLRQLPQGADQPHPPTRHRRRPHPPRARARLPLRHHRRPAVHPPRASAGGRLARLLEAAARPAGLGHAQPSSVEPVARPRGRVH